MDERKNRKIQKTNVVSPQAAEFLKWFAEVYRESTGGRYCILASPEAELVDKMLGLVSAEKLKSAARAMLDDPKWKGRACMGILAMQMNCRKDGRGSDGRFHLPC